jgi:oligosaccharide repeat unit polymerase
MLIKTKVMWRKIVAPEILFSIGTIQALYPYISWSFNGLNTSYSYTLTYIPVIIWVTGYLSFWIGTKFVRNIKPVDYNFMEKINWKKFNIIFTVILVLTCFSILQAIEFYGGIPLAQYANDTATVSDINDMQKNSNAGQLGLLTSLLLFLNSFIIILVIKSFEGGKKDTLLFLVITLVEIFGGLMAGKRQGLLITVIFVMCGLALRYENPFKPILNILNIPKAKILRFSIVMLVTLSLVWMMGAMSVLRTGDSKSMSSSGLDEILRYLELPLINLESQCETIGLGFSRNNLIYPFIPLLPYGVQQDVISAIEDSPRYPEPTSPPGFYGSLHWGLGIYGTIAFSFIFGLICQYFYSMSSYNIFYFLTYCQIAWPLISSHTYNHFFTLLFLPVPTFLVWLLSKVVDNSKTNNMLRY